MNSPFTITRKKASEILGVSTRTVDRYIKSGKLSYKKIANKILISADEIAQLQTELQAITPQSTTEIVKTGTLSKSVSNDSSIEAAIDKKIGPFIATLNEKDKVIEDKNKLLFMLQQRIGELETKLQTMVALPDYNQEKQNTMLEKQRLESKIMTLQDGLKREKNKSLLFLGVVVVIILLYLIISQIG